MINSQKLKHPDNTVIQALQVCSSKTHRRVSDAVYKNKPSFFKLKHKHVSVKMRRQM